MTPDSSTKGARKANALSPKNFAAKWVDPPGQRRMVEGAEREDAAGRDGVGFVDPKPGHGGESQPQRQDAKIRSECSPLGAPARAGRGLVSFRLGAVHERPFPDNSICAGSNARSEPFLFLAIGTSL